MNNATSLGEMLAQLTLLAPGGIILVRFPDVNTWNRSTDGLWLAATTSTDTYLCGDENFIEEGDFPHSALAKTPYGAVRALLGKLTPPAPPPGGPAPPE